MNATLNNVTKCPKTRPALTTDGVSTGMLITLHDSVGMDSAGNAMPVSAGTSLSNSISRGHDDRLGGMSTVRKIGTGGKWITYRC